MGGGPPEFPQGFPCPVVLGNKIQEVHDLFAYRAITFYGSPFQTLSTKMWIGNFPRKPHFPPILPHDPIRTTRAGFNVRIGLGCFLFARRYWGNRSCFLFLGVLRCFNSPRSPALSYEFTQG